MVVLNHFTIPWAVYEYLVWSLCSPRDSQEFSLAPQFESINSLVLNLFMVQFSHPYKTPRKNIALAFVSKVMSLFLNMLSRFTITSLPRSKCLLILWLQSLSAVILEPRTIKSVTVSIFFPIYLPWSDGTGCHDLSFLNVEFSTKECRRMTSKHTKLCCSVSKYRRITWLYFCYQLFIIT